MPRQNIRVSSSHEELFPASGHRYDPLDLNGIFNSAFDHGCNQLQGVFGLQTKY
jgi:hypothetical protein